MASEQPSGEVDQKLKFADVFDSLPELKTNSYHCAIVDYPWDFDRENGAGLYENFYETQPIEKFRTVVSELSRILTPGSWFFAFADDEIVCEVRDIVEESDFKRRQTCIWDIDCMSMGSYHRVQHYPIITATLGETDKQLKTRGTIYKAQRATGAVGTGHERSTAKPVALYRKLIQPPVLYSGESLLEPFAGTAPGYDVAQERNLGYWGADNDNEIIEERKNQPEVKNLGEWSV